MRPFFVPPASIEPLPELPPALQGFVDVYSAFLEFRLGVAGGSVDFSWGQFRRDFAVPPAIGGTAPWNTMVRFGELWRAGAAEFAAVRSIVYEIDQNGGGFGDQPAIFFNRIKADAPTILALYCATSALLARPSSTATETMLARALEAMPPSAIVLCIGYMLSRPGTPLRLEISQIEPHQALPSYLRTIGWPGEVADVAGIIEALPNLTRDLHLGLAFDVGSSVGPRLGLEFTFKNETDRMAALARAVDDLTAAGLCEPAYRDMINVWTGQPDEPAWLRALTCHRRDHHRIVSHFKIVVDGPTIGTKCYFECMPVSMFDASRWQEGRAKQAASCGTA
jgi:hypothetical protein